MRNILFITTLTFNLRHSFQSQKKYPQEKIPTFNMKNPTFTLKTPHFHYEKSLH